METEIVSSVSNPGRRELDVTAADVLRATVDTVLHGAIREREPRYDRAALDETVRFVE